MNILLPVGIVAFAFFAANKGRAAEKLKFYFKSVDFSKMTLSNWQATAFFEVVNPTKTTQNIEAIFLTVELADTGETVGRIEINEAQKIGALGSSTLALPIKIQPAGGAAYLARMLQGKSTRLKISGYIHSLGIAIPFEQEL